MGKRFLNSIFLPHRLKHDATHVLFSFLLLLLLFLLLLPSGFFLEAVYLM